MMALSVSIKKNFGAFHLDVCFEAGEETLALLGASGCGKSMTLRCIAGVITPDEGKIILNGQTLFDSAAKINLKPQQRRVGYLFQNYALFPNMTVEQNILAGMRRKHDGSQKKERLRQILSRFYLNGLEYHRPYQLSGGQQQRVALARILVSEPQLLMLDEPFSALDSYLRWELEREVINIIKEFGGTALLVSHNRDELYRISDRIAIYHEGRIDVIDEKWSLFENPRTYHSALLTGCKNIAPAFAEGGFLHIPQWALTLSPSRQAPAPYVGIRAHDLEPAAAEGPNTFPYEIVQTIEDTFSYILMIRPKGTFAAPLRWELSKERYQTLSAYSLVHIAPDKLLLLQP